MDLDQALIARRQNRGAPLVADLLVAALDHAVALAGLAGLDTAGRRDLESLLADDFVFILGISLSFRCTIKDRPGMPFTGQAA